MEFRIIFSLQNSININTFEVDPLSDSLHNAVVKPKNRNTAFSQSTIALEKCYFIRPYKELNSVSSLCSSHANDTITYLITNA
jgi:hypothetical protein